METCAASLGFLRFLHSRLRRVRRTCAAPGFLHRREPPPPSSAHRRLPVAVAAVAPSSLAPRGRAVSPGTLAVNRSPAPNSLSLSSQLPRTLQPSSLASLSLPTCEEYLGRKTRLVCERELDLHLFLK
jgi:hypothetical protein